MVVGVVSGTRKCPSSTCLAPWAWALHSFDSELIAIQLPNLILHMLKNSHDIDIELSHCNV